MATASPESTLSVDAERVRMHWILWLQRACPAIVVAVALWDLGRWWASDAIGPPFAVVRPMAPVAAFGFLLLGVAFGLKLIRPLGRMARVASPVCAALVAVVALHAAFCRIYSGIPPAWETWLVPRPVMLLGSPVGYLPVGSAAFLVVAAAGMFVLVPLRREMQGIVVATVLLAEAFAAVTLVSYAPGNPPLASGGWLNVAPTAALEFIVFNLGLLLTDGASARLRQWVFGLEKSTPFAHGERIACGLLGTIGALGILAGVVYMRLETGRQQERTFEALRTLTNLKVGQIEQWRRERLGDAHMLMHTPLLAEAVHSLKTGPGAATARAELAQWLRDFRENFGYARVTVLNESMEPLMADPVETGQSVPALDRQVGVLEDLKDVRELTPYVDESGKLRWDLLVPLRVGGEGTVVGAILAQTDPQRFLVPVVGSWPPEYQTGQSVLWRRDGDNLNSLVGFRRLPGVTVDEQRPFGMKRSLSDPRSQSMLTRAIRGEQREKEDFDQRGVKIIGNVEPVPNSTWWLSSRVESGEVYARLRQDSVGVAGALAGLLVSSGLTTCWLWRQRQKDLLNQRLAGELEQKRLAARLGAVMRHAKDIILLVDEKLRVIDANQQAVDTYGWTKEEMFQMRARDFLAADVRADWRDVLQRAPEGVVFETIHHRKDGSTFPVEISARQVDIDGQKQVLAIVRDISERRRVEGELRASQERYRMIAENTSDVIWLYDLRAERFAYISPSVFALRGYLPEEIVGRRLADSLTPQSADLAGRLIQTELSAFASGDHSRKHVVVEVDQVKKDGTTVPTEVVATLLADATGATTQILGISRNITERRRAREAREKFNAELEQRVVTRTAELATRNGEIQALLDSIPDTVMLFDEKGALVSFHAPDRPATLHPFDGAAVHHPQGYERMALEIAHEMYAAVGTRCETRLQEFDRTINGTAVSVEARATPAGAGRLLILLRDISNRKRMERDILANLDREKQLSEMRSQFLSVASHEFRTPLAAAVGTLDLIDRHAASLAETKRIELLARIRTALNRLTTIMNDVLSLSRADSGRIKVQRMDVNLGVFVQDTIREVEAGDRGQHRFAFEQTGEAAAVPADTSLLHHILSNLIGNAVRYSPPETTVSVSLRLGPESFTLEVADEGIGVPEAERQRIFEPFVRGTNVGHIGGTGLGLNIVKRYTELMGGTIELRPANRGTTFRVTVPLTQPSS